MEALEAKITEAGIGDSDNSLTRTYVKRDFTNFIGSQSTEYMVIRGYQISTRDLELSIREVASSTFIVESVTLAPWMGQQLLCFTGRKEEYQCLF